MKRVLLLSLLLSVFMGVLAFERTSKQMLTAYVPMKAADETVTLVCESYEANNDGDGTCVVMYSGNEEEEEWQVRLQFKNDSLEDYKEYTNDDLIDYQSYIREVGTWNFNTFQTLSYRQWSEENGAFHVRATATTSNGTVWDISYDKGSTTPSGDVRVLTFNNKDVSLTDYIELDETFQFCAKNDEAEIRITLSSDKIEGVYGWEDYLPMYSGVYLFGEDGETTLVTFTDIHADVSAIEGKAKAYTCDFQGITAEGTVYKTFLTYIPSELEYESEVDIEADNLQVLNFIEKEGLIILNGSNEKYGISLTVNTDTLYGSWDFEQVDGFWSDISVYGDDGMPVAMYQIKNCHVTLTKSANGDQLLSGWVLASNKVKYNLNIYHNVPSATIQENLVVTDARIKDQTGDPEEKSLRIQGTTIDDKYFVSIKIKTSTPTGTFSIDELNKDYTFVDMLNEEGYEEKSYSIIDGNVTVTLKDDLYTVTGTLLMQNGDEVPEFNLHITGRIQTGLDYDIENEGIKADMTYVQTREYDDEYGHYVLLVATESEVSPKHMLYLQFMIEDTDDDIMIPEGEYEINDSYAPFTVVACSGITGGQVMPSFICNLNSQGQAEIPMWFLRTGNVKVSKNANGAIRVEVDAKNSYGQPIIVVVDPSTSGVDQIQKENAKCTKKLVNGQLIIEYNGESYSVSGVKK